MLAEIDARVTRATGSSTSTNGNLPTSTTSTFSPQDLRGIPAVGPGCGSGAMARSTPGEGLDDWPVPDDDP